MERVVLTISSSSPNTLSPILKSHRSPAKHSRRHHVVSSSPSSPSSSSSSVVLKAAASSNNNNSCTTKTIYKDNFLDRIAIYYISHSLQHTTGMRNEEKGYESLVAASRALFLSFDSIQQRQLVLKILLKAIPKPLIFLIRKVFPVPSKLSRQICAGFTSIFFRWLVGPCEVRKSEFEGVSEKNVVYINKCRFLETSNCAGMCTNLCKIPTQEFMKNTLGIPINMVPNFDDMSCEYIFGEHPPALQDDPALNQPCYKLCNMKHRHDTSCIN